MTASTDERPWVTDTWESSPAKRELADTAHALAAHLDVADQQLARIRAICERSRLLHECNSVFRQILHVLDEESLPRGREMLWPRP